VDTAVVRLNISHLKAKIVLCRSIAEHLREAFEAEATEPHQRRAILSRLSEMKADRTAAELMLEILERRQERETAGWAATHC
jgi:hypothetical protein